MEGSEPRNLEKLGVERKTKKFTRSYGGREQQ